MIDQVRDALVATTEVRREDTEAAFERRVAATKDIVQRFLDNLTDECEGMSVAELARTLDEV